MKPTDSPEVIMVFDPGYTTGFAAISTRGKVLYTAALTFTRLENFMPFLSSVIPSNMEVVCEVGPEWQHHSPIGRKAESLVLSAFPHAHRIPPNRWKSHPASKIRRSKSMTIHEHDAVRLGIWFLNTGDIGEGENRTNPTGKDS